MQQDHDCIFKSRLNVQRKIEDDGFVLKLSLCKERTGGFLEFSGDGERGSREWI